jgi:hypothetical protein
MNEFQKPKNINLEQYQALLDLISDKGLEHISEAIATKMPEGHLNTGTLYSIILHVMVKAICTVCGEDQRARQEGASFFCEHLPKLVSDTIALRNPLIAEGK